MIEKTLLGALIAVQLAAAVWIIDGVGGRLEEQPTTAIRPDQQGVEWHPQSGCLAQYVAAGHGRYWETQYWSALPAGRPGCPTFR